MLQKALNSHYKKGYNNFKLLLGCSPRRASQNDNSLSTHLREKLDKVNLSEWLLMSQLFDLPHQDNGFESWADYLAAHLEEGIMSLVIVSYLFSPFVDPLAFPLIRLGYIAWRT